MESSDDSFVWANASSATDNSDDESNEEVMTERQIESESEKSYKRKLHKKLFKSESEVKHELLNGDSVKHEPDSDSPTATTPRKRKRERSTSAVATSAQLYLEACVKQEYHTAHVEDSSKEKPKRSKTKHIEDSHESHDVSQNSELDYTDHVIKKKKSKRKNERQNERSEMLIEDKFSIEETLVETRKRQSSSNMDVDILKIEEIVKKEKKKKKKRHVSEQDYHNDSSALENTLYTDIIHENKTNEDDAVGNQDRDVLNGSTKNKEAKQRATKISELIQFEDGEDLIAACNEATDSFSNQSSKLRRFLKVNPHLQSILWTSSKDSSISQDDDIWIFNCPHEINISSLKGNDISLDSKCKIKSDSQTFIGHAKNEINRAAILTFEHNKPVIKSIELQGVVNFHKRIPKAHFLEDNIIANNQTNFIPLPDTKCRHPLFGPDYKKAMKIPSAIKTRLQNSDLQPPALKEGKKKKKRKIVETDMSEDVLDGVAVEKRAAHKRRQSDLDIDQPVKKRAKYIKQELESAETWDSEKAIEENLFNF